MSRSVWLCRRDEPLRGGNIKDVMLDYFLHPPSLGLHIFNMICMLYIYHMEKAWQPILLSSTKSRTRSDAELLIRLAREAGWAIDMPMPRSPAPFPFVQDTVYPNMH
jgi:hypothetical protein